MGGDERAALGRVVGSRWLLVAVLVVTGVLWVLTAVGAVIETSFTSEAPAPPPAKVLPAFDGLARVGDFRCGGSHCSSREVFFVADDGASVDQAVAGIISTLRANGWISDGPHSLSRDSMTAAVLPTGEFSQQRGAVSVTLDWVSDRAGKDYWSSDLHWWPWLLALATSMSLALVAFHAIVRAGPQPHSG